MENKKYIDKVIESLVRGTKIDYEKETISSPFISISISSFLSPYYFLPFSVYSYCKNTFGLTKEEIDYVWVQYSTIMKDKIIWWKKC